MNPGLLLGGGALFILMCTDRGRGNLTPIAPAGWPHAILRSRHNAGAAISLPFPEPRLELLLTYWGSSLAPVACDCVATISLFTDLQSERSGAQLGRNETRPLSLISMRKVKAGTCAPVLPSWRHLRRWRFDRDLDFLVAANASPKATFGAKEKGR